MRLHRDPGTSSEPLLFLPGWVPPVTDMQRYWHQPRSAEARPDGLVYVRLWCGQARVLPRAVLTDEAPESMRCGSCVGRWLGWLGAAGLTFTPRDHFAPPPWCPGGDDGTGHCIACGRKLRHRISWASGSGGECQHRPDPAIVDTPCCPIHGWKYMRPRGVYSGRKRTLSFPGSELRWSRRWVHDELVCTMWRCPTTMEE